MSGLAGLFKALPEEQQDNEKLVDLFRNRIELKKEFAALRDEKYKLQDRLEQSQGATLRVQQKMDHLERLLLDREWVHNVATFYQLRRLAQHCHRRLCRFAEELKQQREQRLQEQLVSEWSAQRDSRIHTLEGKIEEHQASTQVIQDELDAEQDRLDRLNSVSRMISGSKISAQIETLQQRINVARANEDILTTSLSNLRCLEPPTHDGLGCDDKRSINLMILSFAQHMYLCYTDDNLGAMAKEASEKSVGAVNYGSKVDCAAIQALVEKRWDSMELTSNSAGSLQKRANLLGADATYRNCDDPVPTPSTVATVYEFGANGVVSRWDASLLADNYFGIAKVLSR